MASTSSNTSGATNDQRLGQLLKSLTDQVSSLQAQAQVTSIPKLKGEHTYESWKGSVETHLEALGLLHFVEQRQPAPNPDTAEYSSWNTNRAIVFGLLWDTTRKVKDRLFYAGYARDPEKDPYKLWKACSKTFEVAQPRNTIKIIRNLFSIKRTSFSTTHDFLKEFFFLLKQAETASKLADHWKAVILLLAVEDSHPTLYGRYVNREKEINMEELLSDLNQIQIQESQSKKTGMLSQPARIR